jgi:hypothetical protein
MYGWANISRLVPSGGRFITASNLFALAIIILYIQHGPKETLLSKIIPISIPILLLYCVIQVRISFDTMGVFTVLGNPVSVLFFNKDIAIINLIKSPQ